MKNDLKLRVLQFYSQVSIPGLAGQYPTPFTPNKLCRTTEEAKQYAAEYILLQLGIHLEGQYFQLFWKTFLQKFNRTWWSEHLIIVDFTWLRENFDTFKMNLDQLQLWPIKHNDTSYALYASTQFVQQLHYRWLRIWDDFDQNAVQNIFKQ